MAPHLSVIEGGVPAGAPRPIVWNRMPLEGARRALVLRDTADPWEPIAAAYDDGRPFLVGCRCFRLPADARALQAWIDGAKVDGLALVDERAPVERVQLADGAAVQHLVPGVRPVDPTAHELALLAMKRQQRRGCAPLPAGGLFDEVARNQQDLF